MIYLSINRHHTAHNCKILDSTFFIISVPNFTLFRFSSTFRLNSGTLKLNNVSTSHDVDLDLGSGYVAATFSLPISQISFKSKNVLWVSGQRHLLY